MTGLVATVLTACGIETCKLHSLIISYSTEVATVLTACGIETRRYYHGTIKDLRVATVLTACGIETTVVAEPIYLFVELQQYLPLAVLKLGNRF